MDEWLTYERNGKSPITKPASERPVKNGWEPRPATISEIALELHRRAANEALRQAREQFEARQDYKDAQAIKAVLEWMEPDMHPLDRLTPEEWAALRKKLEEPR